MGTWNKNFDFSSFSTRIISLVDSVRSKDDRNIALESRINAFYRAIGLPAITPGINENLTFSLDLFKKNNGNLHEEYDLPIDQKIKLDTRNISGSQKVTDSEIKKFLDSNDDTVVSAIANRKRGTLSPMVVDNRIIITPVHKRFVPAFTKENGIDDELMGDKLKRPLIEAIISTRMKIENIQNTAKQNNIQNIQGNISVEMKRYGEEIVELLKNSLINVSKMTENIVNEVGKVRRYYGEVVKARPGGIPEENPDTVKGDGSGELEKSVERQLAELTIKEARVSVFNFDDTFGDSTSSSRNLKDIFLSSELLEMVVTSPSRSSLNKSLKENKQKEKKIKRALKKSYRDLDLVLGTFSGLSGSDVLAIITALFTVPLTTLIGLLNNQSKINLSRQLGQDINNIIKDIDSVEEAVSNLETEVIKHLTTINDNIKLVKIEDKSEHQSEAEKT